MCGFSAILAAACSPDVTRDVLRMHAPIRHRGPDGEGFLLFDGTTASRFDTIDRVPAGMAASAALAFRRLKIVDLTDAADQPMVSPDGTTWIVFNGEIYNFQSLRAELEAGGRRFQTSGDTEVVLAAYERWGSDCFSRFEGMWAIVLLDLRQRRVVMSRDRFGIKPLYYRREAGRLLLASEIRQILAVSSEVGANRRLVRSFLAGDRDTVLDDTFFEGVQSVPPGCWATVPLGAPAADLDFHSYWDLDSFRERRPAPDYREAVEHVGALMTESVRSHSYADVRVGSLLSGGLDSSTIAALLVRQRADAPTFSFGFRTAAPRYCELPYVDALVQKSAMKNFETTFSPEWIAANAERVVTALEEPPLAMPAFAQFRTFELCRQQSTTVVLDGQGSDEIFAGYPYHERLLLIDHLRSGRLGRFGREAASIARRDSMSTTRLVARALVKPALYRAAQAVRGRGRWINAEYASLNGADRSRTIDERLHHDVKWGNAKIILAYADKNAMRFSIEARVPYFDRRLVEYAFSLPAGFKVGSGTRKRVLRDFARQGVLPPEITERKDRMGFATPDGEWIPGPLWPWVREALNDPGLEAAPCFDRRRLRQFVHGFERGEHRDYRGMWRLWMLALWRRAFSVSL